MNGNLYCIFSTEKCSVIRKRGRQVEVASKFHPEFLGLNVRRNGPQPRIFVRSFSQITKFTWPLLDAMVGFTMLIRNIFVLPNLAAQYCVQRNLRLCDAEDGRKEVAIDETDLLEWI